MAQYFVSNLLGLVGAILGGALGFYSFGWLFSQGYYGPMIPGAFLGLGCGLLARHQSNVRGILCGLAGLGLSLYTECTYWPFLADHSLSYFLRHIPNIEPMHLAMIVAGSLIAFWMGRDGGFGRFAGKRRAQ